MINSRDLRIGNLVLLKASTRSGNVVENAIVIELGEDYIRTSISGVSQLPTTESFYGIELSLDLLNKHNFRYWNESPIQIDSSGIRFYEYSVKGLGIKTGKKLQYVHEMQNLYFDLFGEELEINI